MKLWSVAACAALGGVTNGPASAALPVRCHISAYIADRDPGDTNIRAAAGSSARIVGRVEPGVDAVADIAGFANGWFKVAHVETVGDEQRTLFSGTGWMHASVLGLDVANEDPRLYASPSAKGPVIAKLVADGSAVTLVGCLGKWARVRFKRQTGWLSPGGQCSSPLTTCS